MYRNPLELLNLKPEEILDYLRKSQSDDPLLTVEEVLAKHEAILDEWDERYLGAKVPEQNRFREVVSGETLKERPEINKVLRLIESPKYKAVKVVEPQRLTRGDLEDIGRLMKLLKLTNTLVITPERVYDLRDEYDWNAIEAELKRGNDYLNYYKKIQNRGRLLSVSQGNYIASIAPYGYDKCTVKEGKKKCPTLKINPEQADVVRMIFDMYVNEDLGRVSIAKRLNELGIKPMNGGLWAQDTIKGVLESATMATLEIKNCGKHGIAYVHAVRCESAGFFVVNKVHITRRSEISNASYLFESVDVNSKYHMRIVDNNPTY